MVILFLFITIGCECLWNSVRCIDDLRAAGDQFEATCMVVDSPKIAPVCFYYVYLEESAHLDS